MTAEAIIAEIEKLPREEVAKIADFLAVQPVDPEVEADRISHARALEMEAGEVKALSGEEIFSRVRAKLRDR